MSAQVIRRGMATAAAARQGKRVFVVGVGMTKFERPGKRENFDYPDMVREAGTKALQDAKIEYGQVQQVAVGYVTGDSTSGQRAVYELGETGIPVYNVNNNCSTGSTALMLMAQMIRGGMSDCVLAVGFEKMQMGSLKMGLEDRAMALGRHVDRMAEVGGGLTKAPVAPWLFGAAGLEHMKRFGTTREDFARVAHKNHKHSVNNPYAQFQKEYTMDEIMASPAVFGPLTRLQCSPTSDGAAAVVLASEDFVKSHGLQDQAVEMIGQAMATDHADSFDQSASPMSIIGATMTKKATANALKMAGVTLNDIQVIELHDCFSTNEIVTYEGMGLCGEGEGGALVRGGDTTYGGKWVVNPSGGLISKGHPLGATGLAQCAELTWQLRGTADKRQVEGAKVALQHNLGLGGAAVVSVYRHMNA